MQLNQVSFLIRFHFLFVQGYICENNSLIYFNQKKKGEKR